MSHKRFMGEIHRNGMPGRCFVELGQKQALLSRHYLGEDIKKLGFGLMRLPKKDEQILVEGQKEAAKKNRKVCVREASLGSIMPKRVCRTVGEIDANAEGSQQALDRMRPATASGLGERQ